MRPLSRIVDIFVRAWKASTYRDGAFSVSRAAKSASYVVMLWVVVHLTLKQTGVVDDTYAFLVLALLGVVVGDNRLLPLVERLKGGGKKEGSTKEP